ncbi:C-GCAxxG-C-C family (seleno)protein [Desulfitobacterium sp. THU1]|uniref:C-GCAxxG-C-C family (seleno)protein n=1 Tax=Desulfitobacterium sp. THU1 TaxID=3138072 RepID=UPI00311FB61B
MSNSKVSRRKFIATGLTFAAGAALAGCGVNGAASPATAEPAKGQPVAAAVSGADQPLPWPYEVIDPEVVRKRAYENYFEGGCCYAAGKAIVDSINEKVGGPWGNIPTDMFKYGKGGALGWGTLCGALNGSLLAINLVTGKDVDLIGNELIGWYTMFPFPSTKMDSYAKITNQITTISNSPLCHVSVSLWASAANAKINGDEKANRCAKVSGDTAAEAIMYLNNWKEGKFTPAYTPGSEFASCLTCHNGAKSMLDNEQGKMSCLQCHDEKSQGHP